MKIVCKYRSIIFNDEHFDKYHGKIYQWIRYTSMNSPGRLYLKQREKQIVTVNSGEKFHVRYGKLQINRLFLIKTIHLKIYLIN